MIFSSGDYIAIAIGSVASVRWVAEKLIGQQAKDDTRFISFREEFIAFRAGNDEAHKGVIRSLTRLDSSVSGLQRQLQLVVTKNADKFFVVQNDEEDRP